MMNISQRKNRSEFLGKMYAYSLWNQWDWAWGEEFENRMDAGHLDLETQKQEI